MMLLRTVFLFVSLFALLNSAEVDKRFFDKESKDAFLSGMEHNITTTQNKELALLESTLLSKIKERDKKKIELPFEKEPIDENTSLSLTVFDQKLDKLVSAKIEYALNEEKMAQVVLKRDYIVDQIDHITVENKNLLLSYQLQYTLYRQVLEYEQRKKEILDSVISYNEKALFGILGKVRIDSYESTKKSLQSIQGKISALEGKKAEINVALESSMLIDSNETQRIKSKENDIKKQLETLYLDAAGKVMNIALAELVQKNSEAFFNAMKTAKDYIAKIHSEHVHEDVQYELLKTFGKDYLGTASIAVIASKEGIVQTIGYFVSLLSKPLFVLNEKAVTSADILKIIIILSVGIFIATLYRRRIHKWSAGWVKTSATTVRMVANFGYYVIMIVTFLIAINSAGIDLSSFSMFASALAVGVGFGLQTVVSNMVSGIIMMFERSIRVGDYIEVNNMLRGTVTDIRIRSTVIKTQDNIDIIVPNSSFIQNNVVNLTLDDRSRRLHVPFGVAYGTEVETVKEAILDELANGSLIYYKGKDDDKQPIVKMVGMGPSSVDFELLVWIEWGNKVTPASTMSDFLILVYKALNKHNIQIPFPQMDLHLKTVEKIGLGDA